MTVVRKGEKATDVARITSIEDLVVDADGSVLVVDNLGNRLVRLAKQLDDKQKARIEKHSGGASLAELGRQLIQSLNPDAIQQAALDTAKAKGITRSPDTLTAQELQAARHGAYSGLRGTGET